MKRVVSVFAAFAMSLMLVCTAFASAPVGSGEAIIGGQSNHSSKTSNPGGFDYSAPSSPAEIFGINENVTVDHVVEKINAKGNDVVNVMQVVGRYICYAAFIIGVLIMISGCIGNKKLIVQGLIVLIIAGVSYAAIVCGREIVGYIASWAAS